jgi:thiol-disulfide isomerase/thioredoxin
MISVKTFVTPTECPDCETVSAIMAEIQQLPIVVQFETIDTINNPEIAAQYNIQSVPTVIVCNNDIVKFTFIGISARAEYINSMGLA